MTEETNLVKIEEEKPAFLKSLTSNTTEMNRLIEEVGKISNNFTEYEKSIAYGYYLIEIKKQISGKPFEIIKGLMNTGIGFKTDHNPDDPKCTNKTLYSDEIIKNCVVQAIMHGLRIHGNEFNILGGNFYATKEGLERIVYNYPTLERRIEDEIKSFKQSPETHIWAITYEFKFKLKEKQEVNKKLTVFVRGKQGNWDIPLDAVLGKAKRKLLKNIYNEITQGFKLEDADDVDDINDEQQQLKESSTSNTKSKIQQLGKNT